MTSQKEVNTQYDTIGAGYIKARREFYQKVSDGAKDFIVKQLKNVIHPSDIVLLDAGCGDCADAHNYVNMGFDVFGLDSSKFMLDSARKNGFRGKDLIHASMESIPRTNDSFDIITSRYSMHYMQNIDSVYKEFARVLTPNGLATIVVGHPINNLLRQKEKIYGQSELIEVPIYKGKTTVTSYSHTFADYISPTFLKHFNLEALEEGEQKNELPFEGIQTPGFLGFVGRKK